MDMILDDDRKKYLESLRQFQQKVNPKPYTEEERKQIIQAKIQAREEYKFLKQQERLSEKVEFVRDIKDISVGNLKVIANDFNERLDEDPSFEWKRDLTLEVLEEKERQRDFEIDR